MPRPLTDQQLSDIRHRAEAATAGPWTIDGNLIRGGTSARQLAELYSFSRFHRPEADAAFISTARKDVPALLAEVDRLRAELAAAQATNTLRAQLLVEKQEEIYRIQGLHANDAPTTGASPAADPDEWVHCSGLHCPNSEQFARAAERGWQHGHMGTWLCPTCRPASDPSY